MKLEKSRCENLYPDRPRCLTRIGEATYKVAYCIWWPQFNTQLLLKWKHPWNPLKTLELVSPDSPWAHLHLSVSSPMLMTLRLSPFCELYQHACAEGSWAAFPSCPLLFQLPWRQDNGLIEVATCIQALHKPIFLLFLDCSLSKLPQEYFFGKVCQYTIFHQGFWGKRNLQWIAHKSSGLIHKSLYRLYFMF